MTSTREKTIADALEKVIKKKVNDLAIDPRRSIVVNPPPPALNEINIESPVNNVEVKVSPTPITNEINVEAVQVTNEVKVSPTPITNEINVEPPVNNFTVEVSPTPVTVSPTPITNEITVQPAQVDALDMTPVADAVAKAFKEMGNLMERQNKELMKVVKQLTDKIGKDGTTKTARRNDDGSVTITYG